MHNIGMKRYDNFIVDKDKSRQNQSCSKKLENTCCMNIVLALIASL